MGTSAYKIIVAKLGRLMQSIGVGVDTQKNKLKTLEVINENIP